MARCENLVYRDIVTSDIDQVREIHKILYPIDYEEKYFQDASRKIGFHGKPLKAIIVEDTEANKIIGFIFYQFLNPDECDQDNLFFMEPPEVCYILIIGLLPEYQDKGIGRKLVNSCLEDCLRRESCGCLFLHVIDYNTKAISFYRRLKFLELRKMTDFYNIDNKMYSALVFVIYMHGYQKPWIDYFTVWEELKNFWTWLFALDKRQTITQ